MLWPEPGDCCTPEWLGRCVEYLRWTRSLRLPLFSEGRSRFAQLVGFANPDSEGYTHRAHRAVSNEKHREGKSQAPAAPHGKGIVICGLFHWPIAMSLGSAATWGWSQHPAALPYSSALGRSWECTAPARSSMPTQGPGSLGRGIRGAITLPHGPVQTCSPRGCSTQLQAVSTASDVR